MRLSIHDSTSRERAKRERRWEEERSSSLDNYDLWRTSVSREKSLARVKPLTRPFNQRAWR